MQIENMIETLITIAILGLVIGSAIIWLIHSLHFPESGKEYVITKAGAFHRIIFVSKEYHENNPNSRNYDKRYLDWSILPNTWGAPKQYHIHGFDPSLPDLRKYEDDRPWLQRALNAYIVLWPLFKVYNYPVGYPSMTRKGSVRGDDTTVWESPKGSDVIVSRTSTTNFIPFQRNYPIIIDGAETIAKDKDGNSQLIAVRIIANAVIRVLVPERAIFQTNDYIQSSISAIQSGGRDIVGIVSIEDLNAMQNEDGAEGSFSKKILSLNHKKDHANDGLFEMFGTVIVSFNFIGYEGATPEAEEVLRAANKVYVAQQEALAKANKGRGDGDEILERSIKQAQADKVIGDTKNALLKKRYQIKTESAYAVAVSQAEAISEFKGSTLVFGERVLHTLPIDGGQNKDKDKPASEKTGSEEKGGEK